MKNPLSYAIALLVVFFAIYAIFFSGDVRTIKNFPSHGSGILVLGDSLVEGVGATKGNDLFSVLAKKIGEPIKNYGRGGDTTALALERLPRVLEENPSPRVAIILLGGNDFLRKVPKEETFSNLATIIESFQEKGAVVLLIGVRGGVFKDNFEAEFEELHRRYQTAYIPNILRGLITDRTLMFDSIHPNDLGYAKIAERIYPTLKKINQ